MKRERFCQTAYLHLYTYLGKIGERLTSKVDRVLTVDGIQNPHNVSLGGKVIVTFVASEAKS